MEEERRSECTGQVTNCVPIGGTLPFLTRKGNLEHFGVGRVEGLDGFWHTCAVYPYRQTLIIPMWAVCGAVIGWLMFMSIISCHLAVRETERTAQTNIYLLHVST